MIGSKLKEIVSKVFDGHFINREEIVSLLRIGPRSIEGGFIMTAANSMTRAAPKGIAEVHAQVEAGSRSKSFFGLKWEPIHGI